MLKQRIITALVLVVMSLWALFGAETLAWQAAIVLVAVLGAWEWAAFLGLKANVSKFGFSLIAALLVILGLVYDWQHWIGYVAILQLLIVIVSVTRFQMSAGKPIMQNRLLGVLVGWLFLVNFALALIWLREAFSAWIVLFSLAMIWVMDSGAYFAGRRFGKHKLAAYVSPGKTWEGVLGGVVFVLLIAGIVWFSWAQEFYQPGLVVFVVMSGFIAALSVYGDLFESLMKRQAGLKDSGKILPGHGGVLDRIDSLLLAIPLFWLFWSFA